MKNNILSILIIISSFSMSTTCSKSEDIPDDSLTLNKIVYNGNELKINGFYFYKFLSDKERGQIIFLFENGISFEIGSLYLSDINSISEINRYSELSKNRKYHWGVFQIENNKIKYEKWVPVEGPLWAVTYEGEILNDTTFVIKEYYRNKNGQKIDLTPVDWSFHFKQFSPKPDSTNNFIK